jgi:hypothetical protein
MPAEAKQLFFLKGLLHTFASSIGLKVNFSKSFIVPINVPDEMTLILAGTFGCKVEMMPFTYLGLPLGTTKRVIQDFMPLLSRIEKRLMGIAPFVSYAGRLPLVNSVLSALSTYYMCILHLPLEIIDQINKYRWHCLWRRSDINKKGFVLLLGVKCNNPSHKGVWASST